MSGSAIEWSPPSTIGIAPAASTCPTIASIASCERAGSAGSTGASPKSTIRSSGEGVDPGLEVRAGRAARRADRPRAEAGARPVGDEIVRRRADDRDVDAGELRRILGVREAAEGEQPGEVGLLAVLAPAVERIDHGGILPPASAVAPRRGSTFRSGTSTIRPLSATSEATRNTPP